MPLCEERGKTKYIMKWMSCISKPCKKNCSPWDELLSKQCKWSSRNVAAKGKHEVDNLLRSNNMMKWEVWFLVALLLELPYLNQFRCSLFFLSCFQWRLMCSNHTTYIHNGSLRKSRGKYRKKRNFGSSLLLAFVWSLHAYKLFFLSSDQNDKMMRKWRFTWNKLPFYKGCQLLGLVLNWGSTIFG